MKKKHRLGQEQNAPNEIDLLKVCLKNYELAWTAKDFNSCILYMNQLIEVNASRGRYYVQRAKALFKLKRYKEVEEDTRKAIGLESNLALAHLYLGCAIVRMYQAKEISSIEGAKECFQTAVSLDDNLKASSEFLSHTSILNMTTPIPAIPASGSQRSNHSDVQNKFGRLLPRMNGQDNLVLDVSNDDRLLWLLSDLLSFALFLRDENFQVPFDPVKLVSERKSLMECRAALIYMLRVVGYDTDIWKKRISASNSVLDVHLAVRSIELALPQASFDSDFGQISTRAKRWTYKLLDCGDTALSLPRGSVNRLCMRLVTDCLQMRIKLPVLWLLEAHFTIQRTIRNNEDERLLEKLDSILQPLFRFEDLHECSSFSLLPNFALHPVAESIQSKLLGVVLPDEIKEAIHQRVRVGFGSMDSASNLDAPFSFSNKFDLESGFRPWNLLEFLPIMSNSIERIPSQTVASDPASCGKDHCKTNGVTEYCTCLAEAVSKDSNSSSVTLRDCYELLPSINPKEITRLSQVSISDLQEELTKICAGVPLEELLRSPWLSHQNDLTSFLYCAQYYQSRLRQEQPNSGESQLAHLPSEEISTLAAKWSSHVMEFERFWEEKAKTFAFLAQKLNLDGVELQPEGLSSLSAFVSSVKKDNLSAFIDEWSGHSACLKYPGRALLQETVYYIQPNAVPPEELNRLELSAPLLIEKWDSNGIPNSILRAIGVFVSGRCASFCHRLTGIRDPVRVGIFPILCECGQKGIQCSYSAPTERLWMPTLRVVNMRTASQRQAGGPQTRDRQHHQQNQKNVLQVMDLIDAINRTNQAKPKSVAPMNAKKKKKRKVVTPSTLYSDSILNDTASQAADQQDVKFGDEISKFEGMVPCCLWPRTDQSKTRLYCYQCERLIGSAASHVENPFVSLELSSSMVETLTDELASRGTLTDEFTSKNTLDLSSRLKKFEDVRESVFGKVFEYQNFNNVVNWLEAIEHLRGVLVEQQIEARSLGFQSSSIVLTDDERKAETLSFSCGINTFTELLEGVEESLSRCSRLGKGKTHDKILDTLLESTLDVRRRFSFFLQEFRFGKSNLDSVSEEVLIAQNGHDDDWGSTLDSTDPLAQIKQLGSRAGSAAREKKRGLDKLSKAQEVVWTKSRNLVTEFGVLCRRICEDFLVASVVVPEEVQLSPEVVTHSELWRAEVDEILGSSGNGSPGLVRDELQSIQWKQDQFQPDHPGEIDVCQEEKRRIASSAKLFYPLWSRESSGKFQDLARSIIAAARDVVAKAEVILNPSAYLCDRGASAVSFGKVEDVNKVDPLAMNQEKPGEGRKTLSIEELTAIELELLKLASDVKNRVQNDIRPFRGSNSKFDFDDIPVIKRLSKTFMESSKRSAHETSQNFAQESAETARAIHLRFQLFNSLIARTLRNRLLDLVESHHSLAVSASLLLQQEEEEMKLEKRSKKVAKASVETLSSEIVVDRDNNSKAEDSHDIINELEKENSKPSVEEISPDSLSGSMYKSEEINHVVTEADILDTVASMETDISLETDEWTVVNKRKHKPVKNKRAEMKIPKDKSELKHRKSKETAVKEERQQEQKSRKSKSERQSSKSLKQAELDVGTEPSSGKVSTRSSRGAKNKDKKAKGKIQQGLQPTEMDEQPETSATWQASDVVSDHNVEVPSNDQLEEPTAQSSTDMSSEHLETALQSASQSKDSDSEQEIVTKLTANDEHSKEENVSVDFLSADVGIEPESPPHQKDESPVEVEKEYPVEIEEGKVEMTSELELPSELPRKDTFNENNTPINVVEPSSVTEQAEAATVESDEITKEDGITDVGYAMNEEIPPIQEDFHTPPYIPGPPQHYPSHPPEMPPNQLHPPPAMSYLHHGPGPVRPPPVYQVNPGVPPMLPGPQPPSICRFHLQGSCRYGPRCRDRHISPVELLDEMMMMSRPQPMPGPHHLTPPLPYPFPAQPAPPGYPYAWPMSIPPPPPQYMHGPMMHPPPIGPMGPPMMDMPPPDIQPNDVGEHPPDLQPNDMGEQPPNDQHHDNQ